MGRDWEMTRSFFAWLRLSGETSTRSNLELVTPVRLDMSTRTSVSDRAGE
jgi:hypothetical protein